MTDRMARQRCACRRLRQQGSAGVNTDTADTSVSPARYLIVLKAESNARLRRPDESMTFNMDLNGSPAHLKFSTRFTDEGLEAAIPRELIVECAGSAATIDEAIDAFGTVGSALATHIAFVTNAAIGPLSPYVAVEATPGIAARDFIQEFGEFDKGPVRQGRAIPTDAVGAIVGLTSAGSHLDIGWATAMQHYAIALTRWRIGWEPFALTPLYTAAEALEKTIVRQEADRKGLSVGELCRSLGAKNERQAGAIYRRAVIFGGDVGFLKAVRDLSDGIEHGSTNLADALTASRDLTPRLFSSVRNCMLERLAPPPDLMELLVGPKYGAPLDPTFRKTVVGIWTNLPDHMGPPGSSYPFLSWDTGLASLAFDDAGELQAKMVENFRVHSAVGGTFSLKGMRMYGRPKDPNAPPIKLEDVTVTRGSG